MPGIYRILTNNGWGYLGQTNARQPAVYRVTDHIIDAYALPNYHYGGRAAERDNSPKLTAYVLKHGGQSLRFYLDEDSSTAFGFGTENWESFRKFWTNAGDATQRKLDIMELTGIYLGEGRGTQYNTDRGGKRNFQYDTKILSKYLEDHFKNYKLKKETREILISAVKNIKYIPPTQEEGLKHIFDPEFKVLEKAWKNKIIDMLFPKEKLIELIGTYGQPTVYKLSSRRGLKLGEILDEEKLHKGFLNIIHNMSDALNTLKEINTTDERGWLNFQYFTVKCSINEEKFWTEFWDQIDDLLVITKDTTLKIKKKIVISEAAFNLIIKKDNEPIPDWLNQVILPQLDVKDVVRDTFVINFAQIIDIARREWGGKTEDDLKDYVHNYVQKGIIAEDYDFFYGGIMDATYGAKFGDLLFEQVLNDQGEPRMFKGLPVYAMRRPAIDGTLAYVTLDEMRDLLQYQTKGILW